MQVAIFSIKPQFIERIFNGTKKFEYRKSKMKRLEVKKMLLYSTSPVSLVVGEADIVEILQGEKDQIWQRTEAFSGIDKTSYDTYFHNVKVAVAYHLTNIRQYDEPKKLSDFGINSAPQSYRYGDAPENLGNATL